MSGRWDDPITVSRATEVARRRQAAAKTRRARRRAASALALLGALAALAGFGVGLARGGAHPGVPASGKPRPGGTLTVSFASQPASLDPAVAWDTESWSIERLTYQTLVTYAAKPGEAGTGLIPGLASPLPTVANGGISDGGRLYTFHLRPGATFAPPVRAGVTASDVKWSLERMLRHPASQATSFYWGIAGATAYSDGDATHVAGIRILDAHTVQIRLDKPDAAFLCKMALPFTSVMSKTWCAKVGAAIDHMPLGSGPYAVKSVDAKSLVAVRNPLFARQGVGGEQYLDEIHCSFGTDGATSVRQLERGQLDVLGDPIPVSLYGQVKNSDWGSAVVDAPQLAWYYLFINVQEGYFRSSNVRRAVACAVDRQKIAELVGGQGRLLDQLYPEGLPGHQPDVQPYPHDPARARRLLAAAGVAQGFSTTLYIENMPPQPRLAAAIRDDLSEVGIKVTTVSLEPAVYGALISLQRTHTGMGLANWYQDFPDPSDWIGPLFTDPADGGDDLSFYHDPRVDSLYQRSNRETDGPARLRQFARMQDIIMRAAPAVPLYQPVWNGMRGTKVGGFYVHPVWTLDFLSYWKA